MKNIIKLAVAGIFLSGTFALSYFVLSGSNAIFHWMISSISKPQVAVPVNDTPPVSVQEDVRPKQLVLPLYATEYTPTVDVLSNKASYAAQSRKLLLNGNFDVAELHVYGRVTEPGAHYLFLVYGKYSGILNGVRSSVDALDVNQTLKNGGTFTNEHPIDSAIDLLADTSLATTRADFRNSGVAFRKYKLWKDNTQPPSAISVLVAPLNSYGSYGGAGIKVDFLYQCSSGKTCDAAICSADETSTQCLKERYGAAAARDWCLRAGFDGTCDQIEDR